MGRPATHGLRQLEWRLQRNRLDTRDRRALRQVEAAITADTVDAVRALYRGRVARKELLAQRGELEAIANPDFAGGKWLGHLWNSLRRDAEFLVALEAAAERDTATEHACLRCSWRGRAADFVLHNCPPATPSRVAPAAAGLHTGGGPAPDDSEDA